MRTSAFLAAATAILLAAPASAAVKVVDFTLSIGGSLGPDGRQTFSSSPFPGFDPSLGTLTRAFEFVSGSTTWLPGGNPAELTMVVARTGAEQSFSASLDVMQTINIDLNGASPFGSNFPGPGLIRETLTAIETDTINRAPLAGVLGNVTFHGSVTYTYTPRLGSPIPEPSTWAMMLIGFSGLGYAAFRRKGAVRAVFG
jgi:hypothetical protein